MLLPPIETGLLSVPDADRFEKWFDEAINTENESNEYENLISFLLSDVDDGKEFSKVKQKLIALDELQYDEYDKIKEKGDIFITKDTAFSINSIIGATIHEANIIIVMFKNGNYIRILTGGLEDSQIILRDLKLMVMVNHSMEFYFDKNFMVAWYRIDSMEYRRKEEGLYITFRTGKYITLDLDHGEFRDLLEKWVKFRLKLRAN